MIPDSVPVAVMLEPILVHNVRSTAFFEDIHSALGLSGQHERTGNVVSAKIYVYCISAFSPFETFVYVTDIN